MLNIKRTCQRAWRKVRQVAGNCKRGVCHMARNGKQKVVGFVNRADKCLRDKTWYYSTYAEYVERWTKEITEYCNTNNITPSAINFEVVKKDVAKNLIRKRKFKFLRYLLSLIWRALRNFAKIILPVIVLFLLSPFGGGEGLANMLVTEAIQDAEIRERYITCAVLFSALLLWWLFFKENLMSAFRDVTNNEIKKNALENLSFELYESTKNNNNKFH